MLTRKYFPLTGKYFMLINFHNNKQTQENLKNSFSKVIFQKKKHGLRKPL